MRGLVPKEMTRLMKVALGEENSDFVLMGEALVNVYTGELLEDRCVAIKGKWIAYVGSMVSDFTGSEMECLDVSGEVPMFGLIEGHTHLMLFIVHRMNFCVTGREGEPQLLYGPDG